MSKTESESLQALLKELIETSNKALQTHSAGLKRHEQGLRNLQETCTGLAWRQTSSYGRTFFRAMPFVVEGLHGVSNPEPRPHLIVTVGLRATSSRPSNG